MQNFTEDELAIAKSVDLVAVAANLGYTPKRIGNYYTLKEMDSMRIYNRSHWCRFSRRYEKGENGGSQIDFLRVFAGMDVKEAVFWLLDFAGYRRINDTPEKPVLKYQVPYKEVEKKPFVLPQPAHSNAYLYEYLTNDRAISRDVVNFFVNQGLIYESMPYHNIVFKGNDKDGVTRFASMRGVFDKKGKPFKCDVPGNDKRYGFNIANEESHITIRHMAELVAEEIADNKIKTIIDIPEDSASLGYAPPVKMWLDATKMRALGWKPTVGLKDAYLRMMSWMKEQKG